MNLFSNLLVINEKGAIRGSTGSEPRGLGDEQGKDMVWLEKPSGLERSRHISGYLVLGLRESQGGAGAFKPPPSGCNRISERGGEAEGTHMYIYVQECAFVSVSACVCA